MNSATSDRRLLKLADFLDTVPPERFYYSEWVGGNWGGKPDLSCGTTACALGWATTIPSFRRLGLRLVANPAFGGGYVVRVGGDGDSWDAAAEVFGVDRDSAEYLFSPRWYLSGVPDAPRSPGDAAGPRKVAAHIRNYVAHRAEWDLIRTDRRQDED